MNISNEIARAEYVCASACRVCLSSTAKNKCIFTCRAHGNRSTDLWEKLQFYGGIEVKQGDGLPSRLCETCISNVHAAHDFRKQCQETDAKLRCLYGTELKRSKGHELKMSHNPSDSTTKEIITNCDPLRISQKNVIVNTIIDHTLVERNSSVVCKKIGRQQKQMAKKSISKNLHEKWVVHTKKSKSSIDHKSLMINLQEYENVTNNHVQVMDKKSMPDRKEQANNANKRSMVFRRMTSMEHLKNRKELQRRYVKKTKLLRGHRQDYNNIGPNRIRKIAVEEMQSDMSHHNFSESYTSKKSEECRLTPSSEGFSCDRCKEKFIRVTDLLIHVKLHVSTEKLKPATCSICTKNFRKFLTMVRHLHVHKRENPDGVYAILRDIRERRQTSSMFQNKNDGSREITEERNVSDGSNAKNFSELPKACGCRLDHCDVDSDGTNATELSHSSRGCEATRDSASPSDVGSTIKLINNWIREELDSTNAGKGFSCKYCNKSYVMKKSLLKHESKVHEEPPGGDARRQYRSRSNGIRGTERDDEVAKHRCKECDKSFQNKTELARHRKTHACRKELEDKNFKRFLCHICSKTFRHNTGLMFHMRTHTGYKPHVCKYCGRGFTSSSNRINHERTHTGDRPFVCHFCSAAFAKSCTLKAHITTHTGEANYHCKTCGKSFRRLKYLKEHRFTHTGEKPFACKICGTAYSHSGSLFVHEKKCKAQQKDCRVPMENHNSGMMFVHPSNMAIDTVTLSIPNSGHVSQNVMENKSFVDDANRLERYRNIHSSLPDVSTPVRNFIGFGQVFQT